jgi:hypothetical protein
MASVRVASPYLLPRDPATDRSNPETWATIEPVNPDGTLARIPLGRQRSVETGLDPKTGRPARFRSRPVMVQARDLRAAAPVSVSPGTVRRNVVWPVRENGAQGLFSWAGNRNSGGGRFFQVTGVAEYLISSLALQLSRPLSWVVAGQKPAIPTGPDQTAQMRRFRGFQQGTGWPVVAPNVPSYGSRVPLLRPSSLVSNQ